ncbi:autophagy-related protein 13-domain-containing protein [Mycena rebaudengoi]|nr:autophagy-related protein 13-domain-containing protein [Mycena rebaudengoi]
MAAGDSAKSDQIAFHIYTKLFHVLYAARATDAFSSNPATARVDKWFNLETPLAPAPPAELDAYRALSSAPPPPPPLAPGDRDPTPTNDAAKPLTLQILLAVPPAGGGLALVHAASRTRVEPEPRWVLLEEWVLRFVTSPSSSASSASSSASSTSGTDNGDRDEVLPPTIYKNAIPLFRALFALLRILPAWRVVRKLAGRGARGGMGVGMGMGMAGNGGGKGMRVVVRLRPDDDGGPGWRVGGGGFREVRGGGETTLEFGESPAPQTGAAPLPTSTHVFPGIAHPAVSSITLTILLSSLLFTLTALLSSSRFVSFASRSPSTLHLHSVLRHKRLCPPSSSSSPPFLPPCTVILPSSSSSSYLIALICM